MFINTFVETFGAEHPIACGGVAAVGTAELTGAVANAGALGFLTTLAQPTPEALEKETARCRTVIDNARTAWASGSSRRRRRPYMSSSPDRPTRRHSCVNWRNR